MTQHTKGPWEVGQCTWNEDGNVCYELRGIKHGSASDARLIASAPELLEALNAMLENDGGEGSKCYSAIRLYDAREAAKAAIAKATGSAT